MAGGSCGARAAELSWGTAARGHGGAAARPGSAETPARRDLKRTPNPHRPHVTAGPGGTGVAGLSSGEACVTKCHIAWPDEMALGHGTESRSSGWRNGGGLVVGCCLGQRIPCVCAPPSAKGGRKSSAMPWRVRGQIFPGSWAGSSPQDSPEGLPSFSAASSRFQPLKSWQSWP